MGIQVFPLHNAYSAHKIVNTMCHISIFRLEEMVPTQVGHVTAQMNTFPYHADKERVRGKGIQPLKCHVSPVNHNMEKGQRQHSQHNFLMSGS